MIDILSLCQEVGIPFVEEGDEHCHEGWIQLHCPFCGDSDDEWHLGYSIEKGNLNCWRCGSHSAYEWLKLTIPPGGKENVGNLLKKHSIKKIIIASKKIIPRKKNLKLPSGTGELKSIHRNYLIGRNYDPEYLCKTWNLHATCHLSSIWNWRIIAPIYEIDGRIVAYTGRSIQKDIEPRWRTTPDSDILISPKELIYGIHKAIPKEGVLIVEGPSDVWRMGPGTVGVLGIDWKPEQAIILSQFKRRFIMFDPEEEAQKRAKKLANWLSAMPGETEIITKLKSDPGDLSQKEANRIMKDINVFGKR